MATAAERKRARIARRRLKRNSTRPVGASLDPEVMGQYINEFYDEQGKRAEISNELQDAEINDPIDRMAIASKAHGHTIQRTQSLAERGLSSRGYSAGDLGDIERTRVMETKAHETALRTTRARAAAAIQDLNSRRTVLDKNYAVLAGRNIQAGTGIYAGQKPAGWKPPALAATTAAPAAPAAPAPASSPPTLGSPTGGRPSTGGGTGIPTSRAALARLARKAGAAPARRRIRAA